MMRWCEVNRSTWFDRSPTSEHITKNDSPRIEIVLTLDQIISSTILIYSFILKRNLHGPTHLQSDLQSYKIVNNYMMEPSVHSPHMVEWSFYTSNSIFLSNGFAISTYLGFSFSQIWRPLALSLLQSCPLSSMVRFGAIFAILPSH